MKPPTIFFFLACVCNESRVSLRLSIPNKAHRQLRAHMIGALIKGRRRTFWYANSGLETKRLVGHLIGGIGVAMRGVAFGVPTVIILAIAGAIVGYFAGRKT